MSLVSSCVGLNSVVYFRKGHLYSHLDKISFSGLCHTAASLLLCGIQFPPPSVSTALFKSTCSLHTIPFLLPWLLLTMPAMKGESQQWLIISLNTFRLNIQTWRNIAVLPCVESDDLGVLEAPVGGNINIPKAMELLRWQLKKTNSSVGSRKLYSACFRFVLWKEMSCVSCLL